MGWTNEKTDIEKLTDICRLLIDAINVDTDHAGSTAQALAKVIELEIDQATKRTKKDDALKDAAETAKKLSKA